MELLLPLLARKTSISDPENDKDESDSSPDDVGLVNMEETVMFFMPRR